MSLLFLMQELGFNVVTLLLSLIFAYHSVCRIPLSSAQ